ncbi:hypothetical protein H8356DRAFT_1340108 [Neocallimastix lanati (nom. inval.)]|nr:hypothetical protein H8356DRAFT_1340108 [Neocallimastix sp. JGI-2020a]
MASTMIPKFKGPYNLIGCILLTWMIILPPDFNIKLRFTLMLLRIHLTFLFLGVDDNDSWLKAHEAALLFNCNYQEKNTYNSLVDDTLDSDSDNAACPNNNNQGNTTSSIPADNGGNCAGLWAQCSGDSFNSPKCCYQGTCKVINSSYSQFSH